MDAFDGGSDFGDSQASQVIRDLLDVGSPVKDAPANGSDASVAKEVSSDSLSSRASNTVPHYHFHGLATTQTQTQYNDEDDEGEVNNGSQKENFSLSKPTSNSRWPLMSPGSHPPSPHGSSSRNVMPKNHRGEYSSPGNALFRANVPDGNPKPQSASSYQASSNNTAPDTNRLPPSKKPINYSTPQRRTRNATNSRRKSRSSSQDSFAQAPSKDPEHEYISAAKQFQVPLKEIGRISMSIDDPKYLANDVRRGSSMFGYSRPSLSDSRIMASPQGRVLVDATPSHSESSQLDETEQVQTQQFSVQASEIREDNQSNERHKNSIDDDVNSNASTHSLTSNSPSSSYGQFLNGLRSDAPPDPNIQATQPSTQPEDVEMSFSGEDKAIAETWESVLSGKEPLTGPPAPIMSTAPKSILGLVNPNKLWKYKKFQEGHQQQRRTSPFTPSTSHPMPMIQETQPSFDSDTIAEQTGLSGQQPSPVRNQINSSSDWQETQPSFDEPPPPRRLALSRPQVPLNAFANNWKPAIKPDALDVVPDSEPLRAESNKPASWKNHGSPREKKGVITSPKKSSRQSPTNRARTTGSDIAPDLISHDNEEVSETDGDQEMDDGGKDHRPEAAEEAIEEKDEDEDEDDIPLAARRPTRSHLKPARYIDDKIGNKASLKALKKTSVNGKVKQTSPAPGVPGSFRGISRTTSALARSWGTAEVPSSLPEQDIPRTRGRAKSSTLNPSLYTGRFSKIGKPSTRSAGVIGTRSKRSSKKLDRESESEDELLMTAGESECGSTEPADPEENEDEEEYVADNAQGSGASSRKRKRNVLPSKTMSTRTASKISGRSGQVLAPTPSSRSTKRLKSTVSSMTNHATNHEPTRVFALWKQDGHYYSGTVHSCKGGARYAIQFDDGTEGVVNIDQMRLAEVRVGDDVLVASQARSSKVVDVCNEQLRVRMGDDDELDVLAKDIRIAHKTISHAWKDRTLNSDDVTPIQLVRPKASPTPSKSSILSGQSSKGNRRKVLAKTALMVTLSVGNDNWEKDKGSVMNAVKHSGGIVIDDVANIIRMDGKHSHSNNRWVIKKDEAKWTGKDEIERLFLLADDANQKPKFLIALALGIPCLSTSWLHDSVEAGVEKEWLGYALPQGYSEYLSARPSQQLDVDWGNSVHQLKHIMTNAVPCKLFLDKSILCVGQEMIPQPKGKRLAGVDEKAQEAINAVARIIMSMGPQRVEAVSELKYASQDVQDYDYVVIREEEHYTPQLANGTTVHWGWVKDCLIASRLLPLPVWDPASSQET